MKEAAFRTLQLFAWLIVQPVSAHELKVAFDQDKAPYLWVEGREIKGLEYDIVMAALAASGDSVSAVLLPNRRVSAALTLGEADAVTGLLQIGQAGEAFYSDLYLTYANMAITRKSAGITIDRLEDIFGYSVAAWQMAWDDLGLGRLHPGGRDGLAYSEFTSQYRQTKFFWAGRADVDVVDRDIFLWYSRILAKEMDTSDEVVFHDVVPVVRVRAAFRFRADRDAFDAGMKTLRANGEIDRIYAKYGLINPDRR